MWCLIMSIPQQENAVDKAGNDDGPAMTVANTLKTSAVVNHTQSLSQPEENDAPELLTNEIVVDKGKKTSVSFQFT